MKLIFRDIGQIQRFKCGVEAGTASLVSGLVGAGASVGGSILANSQSSSNVEEQLNAQREENQKNRDWQTAEAEKNRNFQLGTFQSALGHQTSEREASQEYQSEQWQKQFQEELQHRFDVPTGVNPAVYFSGHGAASGVGGSVSAPSNGSPSSPSGYMPSGVAGLNAVGYQPLQLQVPQLMSSLGSMMQGLAAAKKSGVETTFLEKTLQDRIRQAISSADMAQIGAALQELDRVFQESTLPDRVKSVAAQYKKVLTDIDLTGEKILTEKEEQRLKSVTSDLNSALADYNKSAKKRLDIEITMLPRLIESQILSNRGSAAAGFGAGRASNAQATQTEYFNTLYKEPDVKQSLCKQLRLAGEAAERANEMTKEQANMLRSQIANLDKATSNYEIQMWSGIINNTINTAANAIGQFTRFSLVKEFMNKGRGSFDVNAGNNYYMDQSNGLIFPK